MSLIETIWIVYCVANLLLYLSTKWLFTYDDEFDSLLESVKDYSHLRGLGECFGQDFRTKSGMRFLVMISFNMMLLSAGVCASIVVVIFS